ncbi:unnamed protein product [Camellia sinensis]
MKESNLNPGRYNLSYEKLSSALETWSVPRRVVIVGEGGPHNFEVGALENSYKVRLADYFDIMAGTSAGALITAMLVSPVDPKKGLSPRNADDIIKLLSEKGPFIFSNTPPPQADDPTTKRKVAPYLKKRKLTFKGVIAKMVKYTGFGLEKALEAVYNGENLECTVIEELGGESLLRDTSTNIVIPTYDISKVRPVIFST